MSRPAAAVAAVAEVARGVIDWRVERVRSLPGEAGLGSEWDASRLLLVPRPGGPLARRDQCQVSGCERDQHGISPLCGGHTREFARSGQASVADWQAAGEPHLSGRRWLSAQTCIVAAGAGSCPRPAAGAGGLCHAHDQAWADARRAGAGLADFLARAKPLPGFGGCAAGCCYLPASYRDSRLCVVHYRIWCEQGRPGGPAFVVWAARVRQPANGRVLSLRGLPELVRLELLYVIALRVREQIRTGTGNMRGYVDRLREAQVASLLDFDVTEFDAHGDRDYARFARYAADRVRLVCRDPDAERRQDSWDLRVFGRAGRLDFTGIGQDWLREAAKGWAGAALVRVRSKSELQHRVQAVAVLSRVLAAGRGGGQHPATLGRADVERFLLRVPSIKTRTGRPYSPRRAAGIIEDAAFVIREARELGLLPSLGATFAFRRHDGGPRVVGEAAGRALPAHLVAQLDGHLDLLGGVPGSAGGPRHRSLGVLGEHAGDMAVLTYRLLKGTGRRVGEIASLHLDCLQADEHGKAVLVYDNHKAARMGRRLPLADSTLLAAIRAQQAWVSGRFPDTPRDELPLLPRANKNTDGRAHLTGHQILMWMRAWVAGIPRLDAGPVDQHGEPIPFARSAVHPHAFRHTYAQTLADQGVAAISAARADGSRQPVHHAGLLLEPSGIASDERSMDGLPGAQLA